MMVENCTVDKPEVSGDLLDMVVSKWAIIRNIFLDRTNGFYRGAGSEQNSSFQPVRFALENFETFYEDKDYLVLSVPYAASTTNGSENAQKKRKRDTENIYSLREFIKVPRDVSEAAKAEGIEIPWQQAMISDKGLALIISILLVAFFVGYRSLPSAYALKNHKR